MTHTPEHSMDSDAMQYAALPVLAENKAMRLSDDERIKHAKRFARTEDDATMIDLTSAEEKARRKLVALETKDTTEETTTDE
jgi:hypothetical protein